MESPSLEFVGVSVADHVAVVTLQRPDKLNALNATVVAELSRAFAFVASEGNEGRVRAATLTGAGKAFVAGADIAAMENLSPVEARRFADQGHAL